MGMTLYFMIGLTMAILVSHGLEFTQKPSVLQALCAVIVIGLLAIIAWPVFLLKIFHKVYTDFLKNN